MEETSHGGSEWPILFGARYSVYVQAVRLTLEEKGVPYAIEDVDVFAPDGVPPNYLHRNPFGKIPAFEHQGFALYEASAIERYVDEGFPGPPLQPAEAQQRARMNQALSVLDAYCYRTFVWDIYVEGVSRPRKGLPSDEAKVATALPVAERCLSALEQIMGKQSCLAGAALSLADLHATPIFTCFQKAPEGKRTLAANSALQAWFDRMSSRASVMSVCQD